jgi:hypothetical protein
MDKSFKSFPKKANRYVKIPNKLQYNWNIKSENNYEYSMTTAASGIYCIWY